MLTSMPILGRFPVLPGSNQNNMDRLPEELIIRILSLLDIQDLIHIQLVSTRYLALGRDDTIWKEECFTHSRSEARRRRQHLLDIQDARLAELRFALNALPGTVNGQSQRPNEKTQRHRALINWNPGHPGEKLDFYEEYVSRHAPVQIGWLDLPNGGAGEATGVGILHSSSSRHVVSPLDDGSICVWDVSAQTTSNPGGGGRLLAQSSLGLLSGQSPGESHAIMTETGAVECVSIDSLSQRGYFGVGTQLHEVDLNTLQLTSTKIFPWPITALSSCTPQMPLAIGTNNTIHLHDPRDPSFTPSEASPAGELIGGSLYSHATLPQPGPLSILNSVEGDSIWVAGRFTSLLNYDRRFFPRLLGTTFTGARIACLAMAPHAYIPHNLDLVRDPSVSISTFQNARKKPGSTILAAAEYKGKGSLELYGIPSDDCYQNRQTASSSKLLSVALHGGKIVCSDGDGNLKWFERDATSTIRTFNIQDSVPKLENNQSNGIWENSNSAPGQGDIVQKIIPLSFQESNFSCRPDIGEENDLLLWTGDGRLGILGFGHENPLTGGEKWEDALEAQKSGKKSTVEKAREDAERSYAGAMRRALERNADEVRFVRGLGMGY